ncbi:MAG: NADH/ubiquinone/plastoquinone (complex I) [Gammaproteobacteria bacterium]|nr:NADH/ubiquinone/plastoquinone (complex I) [Gammaproteobacteria bacterium]
MGLPSTATLVVILVTLPLATATVLFASGRQPRTLILAAALLLACAALALGVNVQLEGISVHPIGGWTAPLGIHWQVTPSGTVMLVVTALVGLAGAVYGTGYFLHRAGPEGRMARVFMPLWLFAWGGLNALFVAADLFNLYVALEVMTLASVALVALSARRLALQAAMRYLLAGLFGSMIYLLGVALLYGQYGVLDLDALAAVMDPQDPGSRAGAVALTVGLLAKAAIFPLHFWLPGAHGRAEPPVSAMLSGLVVAAAFYLLLRLWFGPLAGLLNFGVGAMLGTLGAGALLWGGVLALLQRRLKMMVAYSTVSQFGFAMLVFPLATAANRDAVVAGGTLLLANHALAKAALFLAAGTLVRASASDRIGNLVGFSGRARWAWLAVILASAALIGVPPTLGFSAKWLLLQAAIAEGAWVWLGVMLGGTLLTFAYLGRLLERALLDPAPEPTRPPLLTLALLLPALLLALLACVLGLWALDDDMPTQWIPGS